MSTSVKQDLLRLGKLKRVSSEDNKRAKASTLEFKTYQRRVLDRMKSDDIESLKSGGTLFSPVSTEYATITDRSEFVRWALEHSEPLDAWLDGLLAESARAIQTEHSIDVNKALDDLMNAINETSFVQIKEHSDPLNALVREHLDDGRPLPPGVGFRVDEYISQRKG